SSRRRHTRFSRDWSSDVCSSDLEIAGEQLNRQQAAPFKVEQDGEEAVGILAARQRDQPFLARPDHGEFFERLADIANETLAQLRSEERRVGKGGMAWCAEDQ